MGKRYRAIVIDGKRILVRIIIFSIITVIFILIAALIYLSDKNIFISKEEFAINTVSEYLTLTESEAKENKNIISECIKYITGIDIYDLRSVYMSEIPIIKAANESYILKLANSENSTKSENSVDKDSNSAEKTIIPENMKPIKSIDSSQKTALGKNSSSKILLKNETSYSINVNDMLNSKLNIDFMQNPLVLIVHTHATESYSKDGETCYDPSVSDRNQDINENVVSVGDVMERVLKENGIGVLHDKTLHDYPSYNGSYANSLKSVENYKQQYPSIQIVLDIHRDAIIYDDGTKVKVAKDIDGKTAAQMMLVVGTNDGGLEHPFWRENLKFAVQLQNFIEKKYSGLMRGINLRKERFNGHTTNGSIIVEVGTSGNTLSESKYSAELFAKSLAEMVYST